jgi:CHAT domain-containing protein
VAICSCTRHIKMAVRVRLLMRERDVARARHRLRLLHSSEPPLDTARGRRAPRWALVSGIGIVCVCLLAGAIFWLAAAKWLHLPGLADPAPAAAPAGPILEGELCSVPAELNSLFDGNVGAPSRAPALSWSPARMALARRLEVRVSALRARRTLSDVAILSLLSRRPDRAATLFEQAAHFAGGGACEWSNLAVARLAAAELQDDAFENLQALAAADQAVQLDAGLPQAAFNRALAIEKVGLQQAAQRAWALYLRRFGGSTAAGRAAAHLAALAAPAPSASWCGKRLRLRGAAAQRHAGVVEAIVRRFPQQARREAEDAILGEWAAAYRQRNRSGARQALQLAAAIGAAQAASSGDLLIGDAAAEAAGATDQRGTALASGGAEYRHAIALYDRLDIDAARASLRRARAHLRSAGTPLCLWADLYIAACDYQRKRFDQVLRSTARILAAATAHRYQVLAARAEWLAGLVLLERGEAGRSLALFARSRERFAQAGEAGNIAAVAALMANAVSYLGEPRRAWLYRQQALQLAGRSGDLEHIPIILGEAARALARDGLPAIGLRFQDEALARVRQSGDPASIGEALWWRSMILHRMAADRQALADLLEARRWYQRLPASTVRTRLLAGLDVTRGALLQTSNPRAAIAALSGALAVFEHQRYRYLTCEALRERAGAQKALGNTRSAIADLASAIGEYERQRTSIDLRQQRIDFFDQSQDIFDEIVEIEQASGATRQAFAYAERGRARVLLDALAHGIDPSRREQSALRPLAASRVQDHLPEHAALVEYRLLRDGILAWVIGKRSFLQIRIPADRRQVKAEVEAFVRQTASGRPLRPRQGEYLFDLLIRPLQAGLAGVDHLVLVADRELCTLPFAALPDGRTGRYLAADYVLALAPSATAYVKALTRLQRPHRGMPTALAVGNPRLADAADLLPELADAEAEARSVAATFPGSTLLIGGDATASRFRAAAAVHQILHFAGHAIVNPAAPQESRLLLAPAADGAAAGDFEARDIAGLHLPRTRLVVLSACATAAGQVSPLEGAQSLAAYFLAAGAPAVVANLWDMSDSGARALLARFYAAYARSGDAAAALQAAQLALQTSSDPRLRSPSVWAGLELIGASTAGNERSK